MQTIHLDAVLERLLRERTASNVAVRVGIGEKILCERLLSSEDRTLTEHTLFDMASVTKIVATTTLALIATERGMLSLSDPVSRFFPVPADKRGMTVYHLLTHTMGIGHKSLLKSGKDTESLVSYILSIPSDSPIGEAFRYSCPGFILLGKILEAVYGLPLSEATRRYVTEPLGMHSTCFLPSRTGDFVNSNRDPQAVGLVNDYNCRHLGGVCGNAGLFSSLSDMTRFVGFLRHHGAPIVSENTFRAVLKNETGHLSESRSIGYLYVDERYAQTGGLFKTGSIGHCGHTGQSVFFDSESEFYVIILSDATVSTVRKYGKERYSEVTDMRRDLHAAIARDLALV
jgi:CubicO group peptidase (beta-lactamase class C family)